MLIKYIPRKLLENKCKWSVLLTPSKRNSLLASVTCNNKILTMFLESIQCLGGYYGVAHLNLVIALAGSD